MTTEAHPDCKCALCQETRSRRRTAMFLGEDVGAKPSESPYAFGYRKGYEEALAKCQRVALDRRAMSLAETGRAFLPDVALGYWNGQGNAAEEIAAAIAALKA